jgi:hypothetical protein
MTMATRAAGTVPAASPFVLALRQALLEDRGRTIDRFELGELSVELRTSADSLWALIRRDGKGGLAVRAAFLVGDFRCATLKAEAGEAARLGITSALGEHLVIFRTGGEALEYIRMTVSFTPATPMLVPFMPRDLYPLDARDDPLGAVGEVEARQRGLNSGLVYFRIDEPAFGSVLYFQNLTAMNDYYRATKTSPDAAVGGEWPELGYLLPTPDQTGAPPTDALAAGK